MYCYGISSGDGLYIVNSKNETNNSNYISRVDGSLLKHLKPNKSSFWHHHSFKDGDVIFFSCDFRNNQRKLLIEVNREKIGWEGLDYTLKLPYDPENDHLWYPCFNTWDRAKARFW